MQQDTTIFLDLLCHVLAEHDEAMPEAFTKLLEIMYAASGEQDESCAEGVLEGLRPHFVAPHPCS